MVALKRNGYFKGRQLSEKESTLKGQNLFLLGVDSFHKGSGLKEGKQKVVSLVRKWQKIYHMYQAP